MFRVRVSRVRCPGHQRSAHQPDHRALAPGVFDMARHVESDPWSHRASEGVSRDCLSQQWEDLKREHHEQRLNSVMSCSEKGPLSRGPGMRCRRRLLRAEAEAES